METVDLSKNYSEILDIIDILGPDYKSRLPKKLLKFYKNSANKDYEPGLTREDFEKGRFMEDTKVLLSILYINYWSTPEDKERYMTRLRQKDEEYNNRHKLVIKDVFEKPQVTDTSIEPNDEPQVPTPVKSQSFITVILEKIKSLFSK